jgi:hypothetical protein
MAAFCKHDKKPLGSTEAMARFKTMDFQGRSPLSGLQRPKKEAPNSSKISLFM